MKGKAAVQNANRRTTEAVERGDRLAADLAAEKAAHHADVEALRADIRGLQSALLHDVAARAAQRIGAAEAAAAEKIQAAELDRAAEAEKVVRILFDAEPVIDPHVIQQVAQVVGVNLAPLQAERFRQRPNRKVRRRVDRMTLSTQATLDAQMENDPLSLTASRSYRLDPTRGAKEHDDDDPSVEPWKPGPGERWQPSETDRRS